MSRRFTDMEKQQVIKHYQSGVPAHALCAQYSIAKSTLYSWLTPYQTITAAESGNTMTPKEFDSLKRRQKKLEEEIAILKTVPCAVSAPLKERLNAMESFYGQYSIHALCDAMNVSRATFYNHISRNKRDNSSYAKKREDLRVQIRDIFHESKERFGPEKIRAILSERGYHVGSKLVTELMRTMNLYSVRTTAKKDYKQNQGYDIKRNVLHQDFHAERPNQIWVSDVTCFKFGGKYYYICAILDLFSRKVIAYKIAQNQTTQLITSTFRLALKARQPNESLIFHSDRGSQYVAQAFQALLKANNITQSFSNPGKPHDNAVMESFFGTMKKEELYRTNYRSQAEFKNSVAEYISFYNTKRPHTTLDYKTPDKAEENYEKKADLRKI